MTDSTMPQVLDSHAWPQRGYICLRCRSLWAAPACSCGSDEVVRLADDGRGALVERVWGPLAARDAVNRPAAATSVVGALFVGFSLLTFNIPGMMIGGAALSVGGLMWLGQVGRAEEERRERGWALPADVPPLQLPGPRPITGLVRTGKVGIAPLTRRYCVAYSIELRNADADDTFLRDAVTIGFEIAGNDGRAVVIPPGPVQLIGGEPRSTFVDDQIRDYLRQCDPSWKPARYDPFPYATAFEVVVCEADHVELYNEIEPLPRADGDASYRQSAINRMRSVGVPRIRLMSRRSL